MANKKNIVRKIKSAVISVSDKSNLKLNSKLPNISVDPQTYEVFSDGELLTCEPLDEVPMAQRYFLL